MGEIYITVTVTLKNPLVQIIFFPKYVFESKIYPHEDKRKVLYPGQGIYYRTNENIKTRKFIKHLKQITFQAKWYPNCFEFLKNLLVLTFLFVR